MSKKMATMNFDTKNLSFNELLSPSYNYIVPPFQRDYSWEETDWNELWQDILSLLHDEPDSFHYMGYLVLQSEDTKNFKIVDGQQRITTISIIILAACSIFDDLIKAKTDIEQNRIRKEKFINSYIGYTDPILICDHTKLQLNKNNNNYYQTYIATLSKLPQRGLNNSEHKLKKSFFFFKKAMTDHLVNIDNKGIELAKLIVFIAEKLCFTTITVSNDINAFKVFETLNARGVKLSSADLLKNYIFSILTNESTHNYDLRHLENRWERIVSTLGSDEVTELVRVYWNSKNKLARKKELFKTIKSTIKTKEDAFKFLTELGESAEIYSFLKDITDSTSWDDDEKKYLDLLFNIFNVKQPLSMLIAAYNAFYKKDRKGFKKILKYITIITFRYNIICGILPHEQERIYSSISQKISLENNDVSTTLKDLKNKLYPSDDIFKNDFSNKIIKTGNNRNTKLIKYILIELENNITNSNFSYDLEKVTIEHVFPKNPSNQWNISSDYHFENLINRIGNMCLLKNNDNKKIGNNLFEYKKQFYINSSFSITNWIGFHYEKWDEASIIKRQKFLSGIALNIWSLNE